jgi:hypothetical protein
MILADGNHEATSAAAGAAQRRGGRRPRRRHAEPGATAAYRADADAAGVGACRGHRDVIASSEEPTQCVPFHSRSVCQA